MVMFGVTCPKCYAYVMPNKGGGRVCCPNCQLMFARPEEQDNLPAEAVAETTTSPSLAMEVEEKDEPAVLIQKPTIARKKTASVERQADDSSTADEKQYRWLWLTLLSVSLLCATVAVVFWVTNARKRAGWLVLDGDAQGQLAELTVKKDRIPADVLASLSHPKSTTRLSRDAIRQLAQEHDLFGPWRTNGHLCFNDGDIRWWSEQARDGWEIELEFLARKVLLQAAERDLLIIKDQGTLSYWSDRIERLLANQLERQMQSAHSELQRAIHARTCCTTF